jgi:hypothetical protein
VAGDEAVEIVPATHVFAGCGESSALAVNLEEAIVIECEVVSVNAIILLLHVAAGELYVGVPELFQGFTGRLVSHRESEARGAAQCRGCCGAFEEVSSR